MTTCRTTMPLSAMTTSSRSSPSSPQPRTACGSMTATSRSSTWASSSAISANGPRSKHPSPSSACATTDISTASPTGSSRSSTSSPSWKASTSAFAIWTTRTGSCWQTPSPTSQLIPDSTASPSRETSKYRTPCLPSPGPAQSPARYASLSAPSAMCRTRIYARPSTSWPRHLRNASCDPSFPEEAASMTKSRWSTASATTNRSRASCSTIPRRQVLFPRRPSSLSLRQWRPTTT
mmetsp:Transcript_579/g.1645  ORF Transcript_579/g.1645 Transcript_579/m.1645 type:complete len:235 (-) Transcript_579:816-1520(-)